MFYQKDDGRDAEQGIEREYGQLKSGLPAWTSDDCSEISEGTEEKHIFVFNDGRKNGRQYQMERGEEAKQITYFSVEGAVYDVEFEQEKKESIEGEKDKDSPEIVRQGGGAGYGDGKQGPYSKKDDSESGVGIL